MPYLFIISYDRFPSFVTCHFNAFGLSIPKLNVAVKLSALLFGQLEKICIQSKYQQRISCNQYFTAHDVGIKSAS